MYFWRTVCERVSSYIFQSVTALPHYVPIPNEWKLTGPKFRVRNVFCLLIRYAQALTLPVRTWGFRQMFPSAIVVPEYHFGVYEWGRIVMMENDVHASVLWKDSLEYLTLMLWCLVLSFPSSLRVLSACLFEPLLCFPFAFVWHLGIDPTFVADNVKCLLISVGAGLWLQRIGWDLKIPLKITSEHVCLWRGLVYGSSVSCCFQTTGDYAISQQSLTYHVPTKT